MKGGVKDGYGLLYCLDEKQNSELFEGRWELGVPVRLKHSYIVNNEWCKGVGKVDASYLFNGIAKWYCENREQYLGYWEKGQKNGYGEYKYRFGGKHQGYWLNDEKNGLGKCTYRDGTYEFGEYKENEKYGEHKCCRNDGRIFALRNYKEEMMDDSHLDS
ncbi:hypothetical protein FGO68_gene15562 [Halteria grandinella]|uniref:MORN repeat protein n=1 Tax=Halteria grandinella TaxID=5974 RepID=A0A8J8NR56_HALGN|nr:hypothetical protein FGO68_gene15562 [Halteria grandinella]